MLLGVFSVFALGCVASGDPWEGDFHGSAFTRGEGCDGSGGGEHSDDDYTVDLTRLADGRLLVAGRCPFTLNQVSDDVALFEPMECDAVTSDGLALHMKLTYGRADLDGAELAIEYALEARTPDGTCARMITLFVGERE